MRLILIDHASGYIWGDTANIDGKALALQGDPEKAALEAAEALDYSLGEHGRVYDTVPRFTGSNESGYIVFRVGTDVVPVVEDGRDDTVIAAVQERGERVACVTWSMEEAA